MLLQSLASLLCLRQTDRHVGHLKDHVHVHVHHANSQAEPAAHVAVACDIQRQPKSMVWDRPAHVGKACKSDKVRMEVSFLGK